MSRSITKFAASVATLASGICLSGCAVLHHVQIGDLDNRGKLRAFDIKVSETGINLDEAAEIGKAVSRKNSQVIEDINAIISLFQMGPRTGNMVFNDKFAEGVIDLIYKECPSGRVTGLTSIREMRKYPVISGEIVKVTGYCIEGEGRRNS